MPLKIPNRTARRLWLHAQGLGTAPAGPLDVMGIITDLGFVQLDTIRNVTRAHHHIVWSRNHNYREPMLGRLLGQERTVFEHFTHDAAILPMAFYPLWQRQFRRMKARIDHSNYYKSMPDAAGRAAIKARIADEGPLSTGDFDTKLAGARKMWSRPPHKLALDYMWYGGELATSHRENFRKFYDLAERVIPAGIRAAAHSDSHQIDWLCRAALDRLAFGSVRDIQRFWDAVSPGEVAAWAEGAGRELVPVAIEAGDGSWLDALAPGDIETRIARLPPAGSRMRIINPFDPAVRDRTRLARLFGFDYRIEIFVPAAKRQWGYYVYPLLEGDRFVGRIEIKADRKAGTLNVTGFWPQTGVKWSAPRTARLAAELARFARLIGAGDVAWTGVPKPGNTGLMRLPT